MLESPNHKALAFSWTWEAKAKEEGRANSGKLLSQGGERSQLRPQSGGLQMEVPASESLPATPLGESPWAGCGKGSFPNTGRQATA